MNSFTFCNYIKEFKTHYVGSGEESPEISSDEDETGSEEIIAKNIVDNEKGRKSVADSN